MGQQRSVPSNVSESTLEHPSGFSVTESTLADKQSFIQLPPCLSKTLTRVERVCLHQVFDALKTCHEHQPEYIEAKQFLQHLQLPSTLEPAGILIYKCFSYLASYPEFEERGPVPLTYDALCVSFAIMTGKLDKEQGTDEFDSLLFEALAIPHAPQADRSISSAPPPLESVAPSERGTSSQHSSHHRSLSLADLGVTFDDVDQETNRPVTAPSSHIIGQDLVDLITFILWAGNILQRHSCPAQDDFGSDDSDVSVPPSTPYLVAAALVESLPVANMIDEKTCISRESFFAWKARNAPHLFKALQLFIYDRLTSVSHSTSSHSSDILLPEDRWMPRLTASDILNDTQVAMLSWRLPDACLANRQWHRLYCANLDGFAMNRFRNHVFGYPGPTLMVLDVELTQGIATGHQPPFSSEKSSRRLVLGAYVPEPWKNTEHFWGNPSCFLFEIFPNYEICGATGKNAQYIHYHNDIGILLGGNTARSVPPRRKIDDNYAFTLVLHNSLQSGVYAREAYPALPTFDKPTCHPDDFHDLFDVVQFEVFGLGSDNDRMRQRKASIEADQPPAHTPRDMNEAKALLRMAGVIDD